MGTGAFLVLEIRLQNAWDFSRGRAAGEREDEEEALGRHYAILR